MALQLITPPAIEPLDLAAVKLQLRIDHTEEDALITSLIASARQYCESYQNRVYITQAWELWLDTWPDKDYIRIPLPPLQAVNSVKYYDTGNVEYTMPPPEYFADIKTEPGRLALAYGKSWPSIPLRSVNAVCIEFVAGYGDDASNLPGQVKDAMVLQVMLLYPGSAYRPDERKALERARDALLGQGRLVPV